MEPRRPSCPELISHLSSGPSVCNASASNNFAAELKKQKLRKTTLRKTWPESKLEVVKRGGRSTFPKDPEGPLLRLCFCFELCRCGGQNDLARAVKRKQPQAAKKKRQKHQTRQKQHKKQIKRGKKSKKKPHQKQQAATSRSKKQQPCHASSAKSSSMFWATEQKSTVDRRSLWNGNRESVFTASFLDVNVAF